MHADWRQVLSSFYLEGCYILSDWDEVRSTLQGSSDDTTPPHAMARVMLAMHDHNVTAFQGAVRSARAMLGRPLTSRQGGGAYEASYETMIQLHQLHELKMIGATLNMTTQPALGTQDFKESISELDRALSSLTGLAAGSPVEAMLGDAVGQLRAQMGSTAGLMSGLSGLLNGQTNAAKGTIKSALFGGD